MIGGQPFRQTSGHDAVLNNLVQRVHRRAADAAEGRPDAEGAYVPFAEAPPTYGDFLPQEPASLQETGMSESDVESLVLKLLLARGNLIGRDIAEHIKLPFIMVESSLRVMKDDQLVVYRASAPMNDYMYQLTDIGRERAKRLAEHCSYFGAAPVSLRDYVASVAAQSLAKQHPTREDLRRAFGDLVINPELMHRLGPAVNSGRGMFLYGAAGSGKTSISERVTAAFGEYIWIPRALGVDGEIIRTFDPMNHDEVPLERPPALYDHARIDKRWVRIRRPTIVAGGELTMDNLEVALNTSTGICEAPLQLKSNCGTLVIDDFGRQRISIQDLLNRWIVPLEKRYDYLNLPNGKKIQVPFDQLIIFSTNLEPKDLVDEAFLRRVPYKIAVPDPTEEEFRELFRRLAHGMNIPSDPTAIDRLIAEHYRAAGRPFRFCQPRDLILQVRNHCFYEGIPVELNWEHLQFAAETYFAIN